MPEHRRVVCVFLECQVNSREGEKGALCLGKRSVSKELEQQRRSKITLQVWQWVGCAQEGRWKSGR